MEEQQAIPNDREWAVTVGPSEVVTPIVPSIEKSGGLTIVSRMVSCLVGRRDIVTFYVGMRNSADKGVGGDPSMIIMDTRTGGDTDKQL